MSITIDQVPCWIIVSHISHVVMSAGDPGTRTACGSLFWGVYPLKSKKAKRQHNGRICAKCRAALSKCERHAASVPQAEAEGRP